MRHFSDTVANQNNVLVQNAIVSVFFTGTQTLAPLFSADGSGSKANPTSTNSLGVFDFYIADGRYDIQISGPNIATFILSNVEISDVTEAGSTDANWQAQILGLKNQALNPTPPAGFVNLYAKSLDKNLYYKDDTGREVGLASAGSVTMDTIPQGDAFFKPSIVQGPLPLVWNGNFESLNPAQGVNNVDNWFPNSNVTISLDTVNPFEGLQSLKQVSSSGVGGSATFGEALYPVVVGDTWFVRGAIRTDGTIIGSIGLEFLDLNSNSLSHAFDIQVTSSSTTWQYLSHAGIVPAGAVSANILLRSSPDATAGTAWFDAIEVFRVTLPGGVQPGPISFANLGTPINGVLVYCSDCQSNNPCTGGGAGAIATGLSGSWNCASSGSSGVLQFSGPPTGTCTASQTAVNTLTGDFYSCVGGAWIKVGPGGNPGVLANPVTSPNPLQLYTDVIFKGPTPWVDVRAYGARSVVSNVTPQIPGILATINSGNTSASLSSASTFQNGDGVTIFGAGPANTLATPSAPTITPSIAAASTGTGLTVPSNAAATTYNYVVVARGTAGNLTAASPVGTTTTGAAALGSRSISITSLSRSGLTVTATTAAPHELVVGAMVFVHGTSDPLEFDGWYKVSGVSNNLHFSYITNIDAASGASTAATGGTLTYWNSNHITWSPVSSAFVYYIYGRTGGSLSLLGVSLPIYTSWDDFGSPMMDNFIAPFYVPTTPPGAATPANLTTTIVSGAGTTSLVLANAANTSVSNSTILFDDAPTIAAAITGARTVTGGTVYIPTGNFVINSYLTINGPLGLSQAGGLYLNDTVEFVGQVRWTGLLSPQGYGPPSFGFEGLSPVVANRANPGVWSSFGTGPVRGLSFTSAALNNARLVVYGGMNEQTFESITWSTAPGGTNNDYMGVGFTTLATSDVFFNTFKSIFISGGPGNTGFNGTTCTPAIMFLPNVASPILGGAGDMTFDGLSMSARGIFIAPGAAGPNNVFKFGRVQGGLEPMFTLWNTGGCIGGSMRIEYIESDTTGMPYVANVGQCLQGLISITGTNGTSNGVPIYTGSPTALTLGTGIATSAVVQTTYPDIGTFSNYTVTVNGTTGSVGYKLAAPPAPAVSITSGGAVPTGVTGYAITAVDIFGNSSPLSAIVPVTITPGTQTVTVFPPTPPAGAVGYQYWRCQGGNCGITGTSSGVCGPFSLTTNFVDTLSFQACSNPLVGTGLASGFGLAGAQTPTLTITPTLFAALGTPINGSIRYCSDCNVTSPCSGGGTGALAKRLGGQWICN